jgi:hypothetical protein
MQLNVDIVGENGKSILELCERIGEDLVEGWEAIGAGVLGVRKKRMVLQLAL